MNLQLQVSWDLEFFANGLQSLKTFDADSEDSDLFRLIFHAADYHTQTQQTSVMIFTPVKQGTHSEIKLK